MFEHKNPSQIYSTTILSVRKNGKVAIAGDGQVSFGPTILKSNAKKIRKLGDGSIIAGFAGATADAFTLFERLEAKLEINNLNFFPGRINSFKVIRIHNGKEEESVSNYGELFQSPTQKVLGALKKNDLLIFDNVNISLIDGSTRTSAPIIYKIID